MKPREILVTVGNLIASGQYELATKKLAEYQKWRDKGGDEPIVAISGRGIKGDIVSHALQKTINRKGGLPMLLTILDAEPGIEENGVG